MIHFGFYTKESGYTTLNMKNIIIDAYWFMILIVGMYIMSKYNLSIEDALDYVKQKHLVHIGALRWTEWNTGTEKLYDYLDRNPAQELSKIIDKVSKEFEEEVEILNV